MQFHPNDLSELDDLTEEHLGFSALSDGLGFSRGKKAKPAAEERAEPSSPARFSTPTSDDRARPTAPAAPVFSGIGAVSAGPARPAPSITRPLAAPTYTANNAGTVAATTAPAAKATKASPTSAAQVLAEPAAPRWLRTAAFLLDTSIILLPFAGAWLLSFGADAWAIFRADMRPPVLLFSLIFGAYFLLSESFGGQSLGKMAFNLRVVEDDKYQKPTGLKHAVLRIALFLIGGGMLGFGFLASFWDGKRRPWHDRYTGSIVRRQA
jgi:uncharacterized RDD family membrane protein YckC